MTNIFSRKNIAIIKHMPERQDKIINIHFKIFQFITNNKFKCWIQFKTMLNLRVLLHQLSLGYLVQRLHSENIFDPWQYFGLPKITSSWTLLSNLFLHYINQKTLFLFLTTPDNKHQIRAILCDCVTFELCCHTVNSSL